MNLKLDFGKQRKYVATILLLASIVLIFYNVVIPALYLCFYGAVHSNMISFLSFAYMILYSNVYVLQFDFAGLALLSRINLLNGCLR